MSSEIKFPANPFEDIKPSEFNKLNKKHVTEDFVSENLKNLGWDVYSPFNDTGIDRIIIKSVCPEGHTKVSENLKNHKCPVCNKESIEIKRFVQVKTRQLKNNIFGFTLKSKDIRIDPRHVYFLYSDNTTAEKQDFLIIPLKEYLKFFIDNNMNPFAPTSFRKGNNKLNSLKYEPNTDKWSWGRHSWEVHKNIAGMNKIQNPKIDLNLDTEIEETRQLANSLQRVFNKGSSYSEDVEIKINEELKKNVAKFEDASKIIELRKKVEKYLHEHCDQATIDSMNKYFEFIKTLDTIGDEEDGD